MTDSQRLLTEFKNTQSRDKAIIFDLDGTLIDTATATIVAFEAIAPKYSLPVPTISDIRKTTGYATPEFYYILFDGIDRAIIDRMSDEIEISEVESLSSLGRQILFPDVYEMLEELHKAGIELHIASTGSKPHVDISLDATGLRNLFKSVSCGKPDKEKMTAGIIRYNGASGRKWIFVGDKQKDINAAKYSSIPCVGAGYGYVQDCDRHLFDIIAWSPHDIIALADI